MEFNTKTGMETNLSSGDNKKKCDTTTSTTPGTSQSLSPARSPRKPKFTTSIPSNPPSLQHSPPSLHHQNPPSDLSHLGDENLEEKALGLTIHEIWEESGQKWRPWAANGRATRIGKIVLVVDSDTVVPKDCLKDALETLVGVRSQ